MIDMPKRSVTRFFIPLVDIMMLLFSMFLLLPMIEGSGGPQDTPFNKPALRQENKSLREELDQSQKQVSQLQSEVMSLRRIADPKLSVERLQEEIAALQKAKSGMLQKRLLLKVVAFDPNKKSLVYLDEVAKGKERQIASKNDAQSIIEKNAYEAEKNGLDLYFVLMWPAFPRGPGNQEALRYMEWFSGTPNQVMVTP